MAECKEYLRSRDIIMEDKEIAECYMIMGGIPFYLKNIRRGASLSQNVDEMFFADKGRAERLRVGASAGMEQAQIDLIIKRADKVINVCEMKFYDGDYVMKKGDTKTTECFCVGSQYHDDIERRVRAFRTTNEIRQAIHPVLVTTYGIANNQYSRIFQNVVTLKDLFK